ncbi:MAG: hypothetical protein NTV34_22030 [Proteobacteria bacterium]|nr:hypothetical protein [Pseudomonadota bacterium]
MQDIISSLTKIAYSKSKPFCYGCYCAAPSGRCPKCHSDDLARELPGIGLDWGTDWIILEILKEHLTEVNISECFEQSMSDCYPETTQIGWLKYDTVTALKALDPVSWELAESEWIDNEVSDGNLITFDHGSTHYWVSEVEQFIEEHNPSDA